MARIRTIKPEFFTSEQIAECSPNARLLFVGMWCFCDDQGVHPASVKRLKMEVYPGDDFTTGDVASMVAELVAAGLLIEFQSGGAEYWAVTGWKHQKIDRPNCKYPPPPFDDHSTNIRRVVAECSTSDHPRKGMEKEGNRKGIPPKGGAGGRKFQKPLLQELDQYFQEIGLQESPQRFLDYYQANGWKVGRNPMKDWRATARQWKARRETEKAAEQPKPSRYRRVEDMSQEELEAIQS